MANHPVRKMDEFRLELKAEHEVLYYPLEGNQEIIKPHSHNFLLLALFESGSGEHTIDFVKHKVRSKQLHIVFPDQLHSWKLGEDTKLHQLMIDKAVFDKIMNAFRFSFSVYKNTPVFDLTDAEYEALYKEFILQKEALATENTFKDVIIARLWLIALMTSEIGARVFDDLTVYQAQPIIVDYLALVEKHFLEERGIAFYAGLLNITANYLNILCKKYCLVKATDLIKDRVILEAKRLLISGLSIKETCYELNFSDVPYFSRFFKLQTGKTPKAFRNMYIPS
ncbi:helix-turn-helix domain-containing protein [Chitinophaga sp. Cy-1792]|uniref:helix-turn-helix domain-containing protein n=1 Tax=Chitinophaga sp. Cy-1792 TaxID=2608339 RepID=UPI0014208231|nr:helix-turn-helix domain-containing protein [Chitinophaga sp. Cy-1792]NIG55656.1 helix-turn-helix domain-containing protein [Chitinophaga sp. Cy-1792]